MKAIEQRLTDGRGADVPHARLDAADELAGLWRVGGLGRGRPAARTGADLSGFRRVFDGVAHQVEDRSGDEICIGDDRDGLRIEAIGDLSRAVRRLSSRMRMPTWRLKER